tara:strand:- start:687 stop:869 length:183 start_codon:yes stop_codon:yes gene_type:complete
MVEEKFLEVIRSLLFAILIYVIWHKVVWKKNIAQQKFLFESVVGLNQKNQRILLNYPTWH